ncbi:hypothetical protein G5C51_42355, partial [Streptomyces sp. A7024]|nr:hypothetical protein [Streptomyces coryli]
MADDEGAADGPQLPSSDGARASSADGPQVPHFAHPELPLPDGRSPLTIQLAGARRPRSRKTYAIAPPPAEPRTDGPTRPDPPQLDDGRHVTVVEHAGTAALACRTLPPTAHVDRIDVGWLRLTITGRLLGTPPEDGTIAELAPRDGGPPVPLTGLTWNGPAFTLTVAASDLAPAAPTSPMPPPTAPANT